MRTKSLFIILSFFLWTSCAPTSNQNTESSNPTAKQTNSRSPQHPTHPESSNQSPESSSQNPESSNPTAKQTNGRSAQHPTHQESNNKQAATSKHGIKYTLPPSWKTKTEEFKATDLKGKTVSIQTSYQDSKDQSTIDMTFHPGEKGKSIYAYKLKKMGKNMKRIIINNKEAIQTTELLKTDGKGHQLKNPTKRITVSLLTPKGEIDFVLNANNQAAENTFNDFISKIEF